MPTFETKDPILLSIEMDQGKVHVIGGDRTDTVVKVVPSDRHRSLDVEAAQKTVVDLSSGTLFIKSTKRRGIAWQLLGPGRTGSVDVTVELPEHSSVKAEAGFADIRCDGRLGDVDVRTGAGSVQLDQTGTSRVHVGAGRVALERAAGNADIATTGDILIGSIAGDAEIKNNSGKTLISRVGGDARVRSANGDITIEEADSDVTVKTANGGIRLGQIARGSASIETAAGGLEIGIREGTAAWIDANTKFGRVHNRLSPSDGPETSMETVEVHARTAFGDVLITRS